MSRINRSYALKVLLIKDCDDCPYYNSYYNYRIECTLQLDDEFGLSRQLRYKEKGYETTKAELFSKCPLVNCLGENIIKYYEYIEEQILNGEDVMTVYSYNQNIVDLLNEQQATIKSKDKQLERLYNYFQDYLKDEMSGNAFSEMWDFVKEDEKWEWMKKYEDGFKDE